MAGMKGRSGGPRVGAGRPPLTEAARWLGGDAGHRAGQQRPATTAEAAASEVNIPPHLSEEEQRVWSALAPHALAARTLTEASAEAFADLCAYIVLERRLRLAP